MGAACTRRGAPPEVNTSLATFRRTIDMATSRALDVSTIDAGIDHAKQAVAFDSQRRYGDAVLEYARAVDLFSRVAQTGNNGLGDLIKDKIRDYIRRAKLLQAYLSEAERVASRQAWGYDFDPRQACLAPHIAALVPQPAASGPQPSPSCNNVPALAASAGAVKRVESGSASSTLDTAPPSFFCPVTMELMRDPVTTEDGHSFERAAIEEWLKNHDTSPRTGLPLRNKAVTPAHALRNAIEEWECAHLMVIPRSNLELEHTAIGGGSFRKVFRGQLQRPGGAGPTEVAALVLCAGACDTEANVLQVLGRHPRLVRYYGQCIDSHKQILVTEYAPYGSLASALGVIEGTITHGHRMVILQQICAGMEALASAGMIHRDLSIRNVLLFNYNADNIRATSVKVSDFRLTVASENYTHRTVHGGELSIRYLPPESLLKRRFSEKSDVWAFGVTAWEVFSNGTVPFYELADDAVPPHVCQGGRLFRPASCPDVVWTVIQTCWATLPEDRPPFSQLAVALGTLPDLDTHANVL